MDPPDASTSRATSAPPTARFQISQRNHTYTTTIHGAPPSPTTPNASHGAAQPPEITLTQPIIVSKTNAKSSFPVINRPGLEFLRTSMASISQHGASQVAHPMEFGDTAGLVSAKFMETSATDLSPKCEDNIARRMPHAFRPSPNSPDRRASTTSLNDRDLLRAVLGRCHYETEVPHRRSTITDLKVESPRASHWSDEDQFANRKISEDSAKPRNFKRVNSKTSIITSQDSSSNNVMRAKHGKAVVDALEMMHNGTQFLKYGNYGFPHFRHFHLTMDNKMIQWYSKKKNQRKTRIEVTRINEVVFGLRAERFQNARRKQAPLPVDLERNSFTIVYDSRSKALDLIAIHPREFQIWIIGLSQLLNTVKQMGPKALGAVNHIFLSKSNSRQGKDTLDRKTRANQARILGDKRDFPARPSPGGDEMANLVQGFLVETKSGVRASTEAEIKDKLLKLEKHFANLKKKITGNKYKNSLQYSCMQATLEKVKIGSMRRSITKGELKECDAAIWRANVAMEALEHMMACI
ncbi:hypothetical protein AAMO2058_001028700 [Amorphochlora amoebiformis]